MSIRLHKEHGLNPTIPTCIICRKDKGEVVLLGAAYKEKAPMHMLTSLEPCDKCKEKYLSVGVLLVESSDGTMKGVTNGFHVLKDEAFERLFDTELPKHKIAFVDPEVFNLLMESSQ